MPTNVGPEYLAAESKYHQARTPEEKFAALKEMLATVPKHKGTEKLQLQIKRKLAELKKELAKKSKKAKKAFAIKKEGAATVSFLGVLGSKKSFLFANLTGSKYESENNYEIVMKMIPYENVWLQGFDLPAVYSGFSQSNSYGQIVSILQISDVIVLVADSEEELGLLKKEFPQLPKPIIATSSDQDVAKLKELIWSKCDKIRVQTKTGSKIAEKPIVLKKGSTIKDLAEKIHHDFVKKFKYAKVWGASAKFPGQNVGLTHVLADKDVVEIFIK